LIHLIVVCRNGVVPTFIVTEAGSTARNNLSLHDALPISVNETSVRTRRSPKANDTPSSQRWEASGAAWELREDMSVPGRRKTCRAPAAAAGRAHSVLHSVNVADSEDPERAIMPARAFAADGSTRRAWYPSGSHNRR